MCITLSIRSRGRHVASERVNRNGPWDPDLADEATLILLGFPVDIFEWIGWREVAQQLFYASRSICQTYGPSCYRIDNGG